MSIDTTVQLRPVIPESGPLLFAKADEAEQPPLRVVAGFTPAWFRQHMPLDYGERWHRDPEHRRQSVIRMKQTLNQRFPALQLGGAEPEAMAGTLSVAYGTALMAAILGQPVNYVPDNWPTNQPLHLSDAQAQRLAVPDLDHNPAMLDLLRQMDELEQRWGRIEGLLNYQGVLNLAFRLRGEQIFIDMLEAPDLARHIFSVITETMLAVIRRVYQRQNRSGVIRRFFITANCVVNMIAAEQYHELLLPCDQKLARSFDFFGIHNCAWTVDPYLDSYRTIRPLGYLDFGLDSDLGRIAAMFPETRRCLMYPPTDLRHKSLERIREDLCRIRELLTPCEIILADIDAGCPDQRVLEFYRLGAELWGMDLRAIVGR